MPGRYVGAFGHTHSHGLELGRVTGYLARGASGGDFSVHVGRAHRIGAALLALGLQLLQVLALGMAAHG